MKKSSIEISQISPEEILRRLDSGENLLIEDVREDEEVAHGSIRDSLHIPLADLNLWLEELREHQEIIFVCKTGRRSTVACEQCWNHGLRNMKNMTGGLVNWKGSF